MTLSFGLAAFADRASAQGFPTNAPPVYSVVDPNGVNLVSGALSVTSQDVTIGPAGTEQLSYIRTFQGTGSASSSGWTDNLTATIGSTGTDIVVSLGAMSEKFKPSGSTFTNDQGGGSTLAYDGVSTYTYTSAAGAVWIFSTSLGGLYGPPLYGTTARPTSATFPDGHVLTFTYQTVSVCINNCPGSMTPASRLQSVNSNAGWQLKLSYAYNTATTTHDLVNWTTLQSVTGVNNGYDYCSPSANSCSGFSVTYPAMSYAIQSGPPTTSTATDTLSRVTTFTYNTSGQITAIARPSGATTSITYNASGQVATVSNGIGTWTYAYSSPGGVMTTTVTDSLGHTITATAAVDSLGATTGQLASYADGLGQTTTYSYDSSNRLQKIVRPETDTIQFTYDSRGNVTQTTRTPSSGSPASISTLAAFDEPTCVYVAKCNKPNTTTDALGNVTNYAYDNTSGLLLNVTPPLAATGATQSQTRLSYSQLYAWYKNSSGSIVRAAGWISKLTGTSACQTEAPATCPGTADELKGALAYTTGSSSTPSNLELVSKALGAGDGSLTATTSFTYDQVGNTLTTQQPLGAAQTTLTIYDSQRQVSGVIGPDPDGAGPLLFPAVRYTYNADGQVTLVEQGTTTAQTSAGFAAFSSLQQQATAYDTVGRRSQTSFTASAFTYRMTQYTYDAANNLTCTAVRLTPSEFTSDPASACVQGPYSAYGPDQITYNTYDAANELTQVTIGYGTPAQANYAAISYTPNGLVATILDANSNLTTNFYDGYDRLIKTEYPLPPIGSGASNSADHDSYTYDSNNNILSWSLRSGEKFLYFYDNLNRLSERENANGSNQFYYGYDLLNRGLYAHATSVSGPGVNNTWDALGRVLSTTNSTTSPSRMLSYQYDLDGNRTRLTWPDAAPNSLYATYVYDYLNRITQVEENGATSGVGVLATYTYNDLGENTKITRAGGSGATTLASYDPADRLSAFTQNFAASANDVTWNFSYNGGDQLFKRTSSNDAYSFHPAAFSNAYVANALNEYASVNGTSYSYIDTDGASRGNLTSDGVRSFSYDLDNRLKSASAPTAVTLTYDPLGRLQTSAAGGATTSFLYDGNNLVGEYDSSGNILARYVFGPGADDPVLWYQGAGTTTRNWLHMDNQNSVIAWSNSSGALVGSRGYGPYGEPSTWTGPRFAYTGQAMIPEAQLYHYKARVYDPGIGRFLQTDPIGYASDVNWYAYASNEPIGGSDSAGLEAGTTFGSPTCPIEMCTTFTPSLSYISSEWGAPTNGSTVAELVMTIHYYGSVENTIGNVVGPTAPSAFRTPSITIVPNPMRNNQSGNYANRQKRRDDKQCPFGMHPAVSAAVVGSFAGAPVTAAIEGAKVLSFAGSIGAGAETGGEIGAAATVETGPGLVLGTTAGAALGAVAGGIFYLAESLAHCTY